jgi:drug/metabolite transporter (DMT)-like permease
VKLALAAAAFTGVQVGAAIVASRYVVAEVPPLTLALLRYAIGLACLLPFAVSALLRGRPQQTIRSMVPDLLPMALLGVVQFAAVIALLNYGLQHLGAAQAALIFSLFPLLTLLLSAALGHDRITSALLGGVLLSITGVALALAPKLGAGHVDHWWGELAVLASAVLGATCSVLYRPYLRRHATLPVSAWAMAASVVALAILALAEGWPARLPALSTQAWGVASFIGLSSGVGYFLWLYALKHVSPARVTVFLALNPITAAVLGAWLLGEPLAAPVLGAIALIACGLGLALHAGKPADGQLKA